MRNVRRLLGDERGITAIVAIFVTVIATSLSVLVVTLAITTNRDSGVDRQRTLAVNAAEAGVDAVYAAIQNAGAVLPCRWPATGTSTVQSAPDKPTVSADIVYTLESGTNVSAATGCDFPDPKVDAPVSALITSTGETTALGGGTTRGVRRMQALVELKAETGSAFRTALYGSSALDMENKVTLVGSDDGTADLYTNGDFTCENNQDYDGSVIAQGQILFSSSCSALGDLWARTGATTTNKSNIGGRVMVSDGNVSLSGNTTVSGTVMAGNQIEWGGARCSGTANGTTCLENTSVPEPPSMPFPIVRGDPTEWVTAGYQLVDNASTNDCNQAPGNSKMNVATKTLVDLINTPGSWAGPVLYKSSCPIAFIGTGTLKLPDDLAILSTGGDPATTCAPTKDWACGFSTENQVRFESSDGTDRHMHWIVPYEAAPATWPSQPCPSPGITTDQLFSAATNVALFLYSPCNVSFANQGTTLGQVYSGSILTISNNFTLTYSALPVYGVDESNLPPTSYSVGIIYKREVR